MREEQTSKAQTRKRGAPLTLEEEQEICSEYGRLALKKIAKKHAIATDKVYRIIDKHGIKRVYGRYRDLCECDRPLVGADGKTYKVASQQCCANCHALHHSWKKSKRNPDNQEKSQWAESVEVYGDGA